MTRAVAPPQAPSTQAELYLTLQLEPDSGSALLRVVSTLHRRRCRILQASFRQVAGSCDELQLHILAPRAYAVRVEHWLLGLIDVRGAVTVASD